MARVYISLPITGQDPDLVEVMANGAAEYIRSCGDEPINPLEVCADGTPYHECMGRDIAALLTCQYIWLLTGWEGSQGCRAEAAVAAIYSIEPYMERIGADPLSVPINSGGH